MKVLLDYCYNILPWSLHWNYFDGQTEDLAAAKKVFLESSDTGYRISVLLLFLIH